MCLTNGLTGESACALWGAGYIHLKLPVFHIGFFKQTLSVLSCICKTCSRVVLSESESARFYKAFRRCDKPGIPTQHALWKHETLTQAAA